MYNYRLDVKELREILGEICARFLPCSVSGRFVRAVVGAANREGMWFGKAPKQCTLGQHPCAPIELRPSRWILELWDLCGPSRRLLG